MSTITVVKKNNLVCMACETQTSMGNSKMSYEYQENQTKIIEWGDSIVGMVGYVALKMIIKDIILKEKESPDFSDEMKIFKYFNKLHNTLKKKYHLNSKESEDDPVESSQYEILIANKHGIFGVYSLREVNSFSKFWSFGSGCEYALGAMNAVYYFDDFDAEKIAIQGVKAGVDFDTSSGGKIISKTIKLISTIK